MSSLDNVYVLYHISSIYFISQGCQSNAKNREKAGKSREEAACARFLARHILDQEGDQSRKCRMDKKFRESNRVLCS